MPRQAERSLRAQQREWYARLRADGFEDIEYAPDERGIVNGPLRGAHARNAEAMTDPDGRAEYYARARRLVHERRFASPRERRIAELWAEGETVRDIMAQTVRSAKIVHTTIRRMEAEMLGKATERVSDVRRVRGERGNKRALAEGCELLADMLFLGMSRH